MGTPGAISLLEENNKAASELLDRHVSGDWGDLCEDDKQLNEAALKEGSRLFSSYTLGEGKLWIITEADRSSTTLLLPSEY